MNYKKMWYELMRETADEMEKAGRKLGNPSSRYAYQSVLNKMIAIESNEYYRPEHRGECLSPTSTGGKINEQIKD